MIILDALVACIIFKIFGIKGLYCLGMTALITFMRFVSRVSYMCDLIETTIYFLGNEDKEEAENE